MPATCDPWEYFAKKVDRRGDDECWPWIGAVNNGGYGAFQNVAVSPKPLPASRATWIMFKGGDPGDLDVCHTCDNTLCCNPGHLFLGSRKENMQDCVDKGRSLHGERNHFAELTPDRVKVIRAVHRATKAPYAVVARAFGISTSNCHRIVSREIWTHV